LKTTVIVGKLNLSIFFRRSDSTLVTECSKKKIGFRQQQLRSLFPDDITV